MVKKMRERASGSAAASEEDVELLEKVAKLLKDANAVVGGKDGPVVSKELEVLKTEMTGITLTKDGRSKLEENIKEIEDGVAFEKTGGHQGKAADLLGIPRSTLQSKIRK